MEKRKVYYTGEFDASQILSTVKEMKNALANVDINDSGAKEFLKTLDKIAKEAESFQSMIKTGFSSIGEIEKFGEKSNALGDSLTALGAKFKELKAIFSTEGFSNPNDLKNYQMLEDKVEAVSSKIMEIRRQFYQQDFSSVFDPLDQSVTQFKVLLATSENVNNTLDDQKIKYEQELQSAYDLYEAAEEQSKALTKQSAELYMQKNALEAAAAEQLNVVKAQKEGSAEAGIATEKYAAIKAQLKNVRTEITAVEAQQVKNTKEMKAQEASFENAENILKIIVQLYRMINTPQEELVESEKQMGAFLKLWVEQINNANSELKETGMAMENLERAQIEVNKNGISKLGKDAETAGSEIKQTAKDTERLSDSLQMGQKADSFFDKIKSRVAMVFDLGNAFQWLRQGVNFAFESIKSLDSAFTEIAVVTNKTNQELWQSFDTYNKMAQELGVTTGQAIQTSALYYQQGLDTADVMNLTTETIKMARIAGMDFSEATDRMTAAIRGFKLEMSDAAMVNDIFSALAAKSAVDTDELSYALTKTASIANSAGMSIQTTSAFLSQMIETTREAPENIGTAMKTIIARFQELKNSVSGTVDDETVDVNKVDKALKTVGVSLRDNVTGQFRDLDDVFLELASKWDGLDRNTQRYIATIAAGSRQQSRFLAMMDNYSRTTELIDIATNSAGASSAQFEKTVDSIESKINKIKASGEQIIGNLDSNNIARKALDGINNVLQTIAKVTKSNQLVPFATATILMIKNIISTGMSGLQTLSTGLAKIKEEIYKPVPFMLKTSFVDENGNPTTNPIKDNNQKITLHEQVIVTKTEAGSTTTTDRTVEMQGVKKDKTPTQTDSKIMTWMQQNKNLAIGINGVASVLGSILSVTNLINTAQQTQSALEGATYGQAAGSVIGSLANLIAPGLGMALSPLLGSIGGIIGSAVGNAIDAKKGIFSEAYAQKLSEQKSANTAAAQESTSTYDTMKEQIDQYEELSNKTNLTVEEKNKLYELNNSLIQQFPDMYTYYDSELGFFRATNAELKEKLNLQRQENDINNMKVKATSYQESKIALGTGPSAEESVSRIATKYGTDFAFNDATGRLASGTKDSLSRMLKAVQEGKMSIDDVLQQYDGAEQYKAVFQEMYDDYKNALSEYQKSIADLSSSTAKDIATQMISSFVSAQETTEDNPFDQGEQQQLQNQIEAMGIISPKDIQDIIDKYGDDTEGLKKALDEYYSKVQNQTKSSYEGIQNQSNTDKNNLAILKSIIGFADKETFENLLKTMFPEDMRPSIIQQLFGQSSLDTVDFSKMVLSDETLGSLGVDLQKRVLKVIKSDPEAGRKITTAFSDWFSGDQSFEAFNNITNQLEETFGDGSDEVVMFTNTVGEQLKTITPDLTALSGAIDTLGTSFKSLDDLKTKALSGTLTTLDAQSLMDNFGLSQENFQVTIDGLKLVGTTIEEIKTNALAENKETVLEKYQKSINLITAGRNDVMNAFATSGNALAASITSYEQLLSAVATMPEALSGFNEEQLNVYNAALAAASGLSSEKQALEAIDGELSNQQDYGALISNMEVVSQLGSSMSAANAALTEFSANGQIAINTALSMVQADSDYAAALDVVNGHLVLNQSVIKQVNEAKIAAYKNDLEIRNAEIRMQISSLQALIDNEVVKQQIVTESYKNGITNIDEFNNLKSKLALADKNTQIKIGTDLATQKNTILKQQDTDYANFNTSEVSILTQRAQQEALLLGQMNKAWSNYYKAVKGEATSGTTAITPQGIIQSMFKGANYSSLLGSSSADSLSKASASIQEAVKRDLKLTDDELYDFSGFKSLFMTDSNSKIKGYQEQLGVLQKELSNNLKFANLSISEIEGLSKTYSGLGTSKSSSGSATKAASEYSLEMDKLYNILSLISDKEREISELELKRKSLSNAEDLAKNDQQRIKEAKTLQAYYSVLLDQQTQQRDLIGKQLAAGYSQYVSVKDGYLQIDNARIATITNKELGDSLKKLTDEYDKYSTSISQTNEKIQKQIEYQKEIITTARKYSQTLKDQILKFFIAEQEAEIKAVKNKYEVIKKADSDYLTSLRDSITKQRNLRSQSNEKQELENKEKRLALLQRDTSGIYAEEIASLKKEIADARQSLSDTETDNMVESYEKQLDAAHDAMDDEVSYLEEKHQKELESMTNYWAEVDKIYQGGSDKILSYLKDNDTSFITGSKESQEEWLEAWKKNIEEALAYKKLITGTTTTTPSSTATTSKPSSTSSSSSTPSKPASTSAASTPTAVGSKVKAKSGSKIYASYTTTRGSNPYFGTGPYVIIGKPTNGRVAVRSTYAKSGVTGIFKLSDLVGYSKGGLVSSTGPVMVHGTKSKPEAFLSAKDTQNIAELKQILSQAIPSIKNTPNNSTTNNGDSYYEIHIDVDKLANDYDVDDMMDAIEKKLLKDAKSRNSIAIKRSR